MGPRLSGPGEKGEIGPTGPPAPVCGFSSLTLPSNELTTELIDSCPDPTSACPLLDFWRVCLVHVGPRYGSQNAGLLVSMHMIARRMCVDLMYFIFSGVQSTDLPHRRNMYSQNIKKLSTFSVPQPHHSRPGLSPLSKHLGPG